MTDGVWTETGVVLATLMVLGGVGSALGTWWVSRHPEQAGRLSQRWKSLVGTGELVQIGLLVGMLLLLSLVMQLGVQGFARLVVRIPKSLAGGSGAGLDPGAVWVFLPVLLSLLVVRWVHRPAHQVWGMALAFFGGAALMAWPYQTAYLRDLQSPGGALPFFLEGSLILTTGAVACLYLAVVPLGLLAGLFCYRLHPRSWCFVLGAWLWPQLLIELCEQIMNLLIGATSSVGTMPEWQGALRAKFIGDWWSWALSQILLLGCLVLLWSQSRQRAGFLRLMQMEEGGMEREGADPLAAVGRGVFVLLLGVHLALALGAMVGSARMTQLITQGPTPRPFSPALVNGWDFLAERFTRDVPRPDKERLEDVWRLPEAIHQISMEPAPSLDQWRRLLTPESRRQLRDLETSLTQPLEDLRLAAQSDYLSTWRDGKWSAPSFLMLRTAIRTLQIQAAIATVDGDSTAALRPITTLYRFSALEVDGPLISQGIHIAIRGMANRSAVVYWEQFHEDRGAMEGLARVLEQTSVGNRRSYPWETILRYEPGLGSVVLHAEVTVPGTRGMVNAHGAQATRFDELRLATAAALYRLDRGAWPSDLQDLQPAYLPTIPRDGYEGKPFEYRVESDRLVIRPQRKERAPVGPRNPVGGIDGFRLGSARSHSGS